MALKVIEAGGALMKSTILAATALLVMAHAALAQQIESTPRPKGEVVAGYLAPGALDFGSVLPAPPAPGSLADDMDVATVMALQTKASPERFAIAGQDAAYLYPRFDEAFGGAIDRTHAPALVHLLNRVLTDVVAQSDPAKLQFSRPRPFQRFQLTRICGQATPPAPDPNPKVRSSYPSGHSSVDWGAALVLVQVAPERRARILERAYDYEFSRVVCGYHFPSDVEAGHALATAVVERLQAEPSFQEDLDAARAEYRAGRGR
jgi:acid phosphatase (class A)